MPSSLLVGTDYTVIIKVNKKSIRLHNKTKEWAMKIPSAEFCWKPHVLPNSIPESFRLSKSILLNWESFQQSAKYLNKEVYSCTLIVDPDINSL